MIADSSSIAARTGAWALIVAATVELAADLVSSFLYVQLVLSEHAGGEWRRLAWAFEGALPLQTALFAVVVVATARLVRGTADPVARVLFRGTCLVWGLRLLPPAATRLFGARGDYDAWGFATPWERFLEHVHGFATAVDQLAVVVLLAALWRARRAWGRGPGLMWSLAAIGVALRLAVTLGFLLGGSAATIDGPAAIAWFHAGTGGLALLAGVALALALTAFARAAPAESDAARWAAAGAGLENYRAALIVRVALLLPVLSLVLAGVLLRGSLPPTMTLGVLVATVAAGMLAGVAQIAGLTGYAAAPAAIARPALAVATAATGLVLAIESLFLGWLSRALSGRSSFGDAVPPGAVIGNVGLVGQLLAALAAVALLVSLRRAAHGLGAAALRERAQMLLYLGLGGGVSLVLVRGLALELVAHPWLALMLGLVALAIGGVVLVAWLRLLEELAAAMDAR